MSRAYLGLQTINPMTNYFYRIKRGGEAAQRLARQPRRHR